MLQIDLLVLDQPTLRGEYGPVDPAARGTSQFVLIEHKRSAREQQMSLKEAIACAQSEEPPIVVEHDGGEHFSGFFSPRRDAYPTPRHIKQVIEKAHKECSKKRARD